MTVRSRGVKARQNQSPVEGREDYIRQNAVAIVQQRDAKILRQTKELARLNAACRGLRRQLEKERQQRQDSSSVTGGP
jgi:hypothetical protein